MVEVTYLTAEHVHTFDDDEAVCRNQRTSVYNIPGDYN